MKVQIPDSLGSKSQFTITRRVTLDELINPYLCIYKMGIMLPDDRAVVNIK